MNARSLAYSLALLTLASASPAPGAESSPTPPSSPATMAKVDINTADIPALEAIPEIGTNFANAVVAGRPFKSIDDLDRILKIGPEKMATLRRKVIASPVKSVTPPAPSEPDKSTTRNTAGSKAPKVNEGKATDRKEVDERYDRTQAAEKSDKKK